MTVTTMTTIIITMILLCGMAPTPAAAFLPVVVVSPSTLSAALGLVLTLTSPTPMTPSPPPSPLVAETTLVNNPNSVPILEVVKVYGKLAGSECYGKQAPRGSSCQINLNELKQMLGSPSARASTEASTTIATVVSRDDFAATLGTMEFLWPLKPFGLDQSPSLAKTVVMNKGAETMVFMQELEARGLYDPRNPAGPLPTSLRPSLNKVLQKEGVLDERAIARTYELLFGSSSSNAGAGNSPAGLLLRDGSNHGEGTTTTGYLDYYEFLKMFGPNSISWPKY